MEKFVSYEKLTKQKQRELSTQKRITWGALNPVTRKPQNLKVYNRKKTRQLEDDSNNAESFYYLYN